MPLSRNLGTLTSWNPLGHSRPVTGLLFTNVFRRNRHFQGAYTNVVETNKNEIDCRNTYINICYANNSYTQVKDIIYIYGAGPTRIERNRRFLISNFRPVLNLVCILLGNSPASDCGLPTFRNPLSVSSSRAGCTVLYIQHLKMELIGGSEMSANHNRTPGKYPKEYIQDSKHGESLKSRIFP